MSARSGRKSQEGQGKKAVGLVTIDSPESIAAEAYRTLRTSLLYSVVDEPPRVIMVTSPGPKEGKSTSISNLAVAMSDAGRSVILLDCDLRRPSVHEVFGLRNSQGVMNVLVDERPVEEVWHEPLENLRIVTSGAIPPNPAELLGSERFSRLLESLRDKFDYVFVDAPPVQLVADPAIISANTDGVLVVVDARNTRKRLVRRSIRSLESVGANVLGTVLNNVKTSDSGLYGYSSSYTQ